MKKTLRRMWMWWGAAVVILLGAAAWASLPKSSWSSGEVLRASDLTNDMQHLEAGLKGGTHTAIVNADLSASAAVVHTKLLYPPITALMNGVCSSSPCTLHASLTRGVTSVTRTSAGIYVVNFAARTDNLFIPQVQVVSPTNMSCAADTFATTSFTIRCIVTTEAVAPTATDAQLGITMYDNT